MLTYFMPKGAHRRVRGRPAASSSAVAERNATPVEKAGGCRTPSTCARASEVFLVEQAMAACDRRGPANRGAFWEMVVDIGGGTTASR